jgi:iron complex outermembrane receptor protein
MKSRLFRAAAIAALTAGPTLLCAVPALAQQQLQEVIVTARKRQESILNVPVVETALPAQQLQRLQVKDMKDVASLVPGLSFGDNFLSIGTQVSLRGVGTNAYDPGVDQSITLVLDGLSLANGLAFMSGTFDAGQIEVLKGPQSLFYGKAAPGGVISIRTADPTDTPEIIMRAGYEFEARERRGEMIVSGPLSDTVKARVAGFYSKQDGFYKNIVTGPLPAFGGRLAPSRVPQQKNWMVRGTVLWNPTKNFDARLKVNNVYDWQGDQGALQLAQCPDGTKGVTIVGTAQFLNPADDCRLDRDVSWIELDPKFFPNALDGGKGFIETTQTYGTLELNYRPQPELTLTSTTAYYLLHSHSDFEASSASWWGPGIEATNGFRRREFTEELRANSDFSGPLNFTAGGFFERGRISDQVAVYGNTAPVLSVFGIPAGLEPILQKGTNIVHIETESLFGQLRWKVVPQVEIAAGARWTHERKTNDPFLEFLEGVPPGSPILGFQVKPTPTISSSKVAPELTITYKPTDDVTIFGSLKKASKSGGFHIGTPPDTSDNSFGEESVKGGELGLKSRWLDRTLLFNLAGYHYKYSGLQVGAIVPVQGSSIPVTTVVNAGSATVTGVEAEVVYRPPQVADLTVHADVNYNHTKYNDLNGVPCFGGQSIEQGCNQLFSSSINSGLGGFQGQSASGLPLVRSADWQANFGFDWQTAVGRDMMLVVTNNQHVSSRYLANLGKPFYQPSFIKADLALTLEGPHDRWEVALIGKNLNNSLTAGSCTNFNGRGGLVVPQITGRPAGPLPTGSPGFAGEDQIACLMDRGRELWIRVTFKPLS